MWGTRALIGNPVLRTGCVMFGMGALLPGFDFEGILGLSSGVGSPSGAWGAEPGSCASFQTADAAFGWAAWQVMSEGCPRVASQLRASPAEPGNR